MKITASEISPTSSSLWVGVRIEYTKNGPIRFAVVEVPYALFTPEVRQNLLSVFNLMVTEYLDDEPLF